ncbi:MAG: hypothetical protein U0414_25290 [Polyangiaceae bacterium]
MRRPIALVLASIGLVSGCCSTAPLLGVLRPARAAGTDTAALTAALVSTSARPDPRRAVPAAIRPAPCVLEVRARNGTRSRTQSS